MSLIKIHNIETGEIIEREMNAEEFAQWEADNMDAKAKAEALKQIAAAKAALLEKLGITEDEAKLLLK
jgi:AmiR/NasT family two-component response regulator